MKVISYKDGDYKKSLDLLYNRPACPPEIETAVAAIVSEVRRNGDQAICKFMKKFDSLDITPAGFRVTEKEFEEAEEKIDSKAKEAIAAALKNIQIFASHQLPKNWNFSPRPGVVLGEKFTPMDRVGCYIPGGTAPLVSTVLHTAGIAAAAGVKEIVAATPPMKDGSIHAATLYALNTAGVKEVYRMGGAYAIAALAYGTDTVRKVEKIVGPGNAYVAAAKKIVYGSVAIDMVAGPSEIMIVADSEANPAFIAADMLSQAEHGSGLEQAVLVTDCAEIIHQVKTELLKQAETLSRNATVERVLEHGVFFIEAADIDEALVIAGNYAPEHIELMFKGAEHRAWFSSDSGLRNRREISPQVPAMCSRQREPRSSSTDFPPMISCAGAAPFNTPKMRSCARLTILKNLPRWNGSTHMGAAVPSAEKDRRNEFLCLLFQP